MAIERTPEIQKLRQNMIAKLVAAQSNIKNVIDNLKMANPDPDDPDPRFLVDGDFHERLISVHEFIGSLIDEAAQIPPDKLFEANED